MFTVKDSYPPVKTPKRDERNMSANRDRLFNVIPATVHTWRPSSLSEIWASAMSRWQRPFNTNLTIYYIQNMGLVLCLKQSLEHPINLWLELMHKWTGKQLKLKKEIIEGYLFIKVVIFQVTASRFLMQFPISAIYSFYISQAVAFKIPDKLKHLSRVPLRHCNCFN